MYIFLEPAIEYQGIDSFHGATCPMEATKNFKQTNIDLTLCTPPQKPDIEHVIGVNIDKEIIRTKIVKTPIGESLEGQIVTGHKILIMSDLTLKVTYVADKEAQSVHSFHTTIPFCEYVVMDKKFNTLGVVTADVYIEDVYVEQCSKRCLYGNITTLTVAQPCV